MAADDSSTHGNAPATEDSGRLTEGRLSEVMAVRRAKLDALRAEGMLPFAERYPRTHTLAQARTFAVDQLDDDAEDGVLLAIAGRVMMRRAFGKLIFLQLQDGSGRCQVVLDESTVGKQAIEQFQRFVDLGDHIGVEGMTGRTRKGEPSVFATGWVFLSKALRPLPEKWSGLTDAEAKQRERYLDLVSNPSTRERFRFRSRFVKEMRRSEQ